MTHKEPTIEEIAAAIGRLYWAIVQNSQATASRKQLAKAEQAAALALARLYYGKLDEYSKAKVLEAIK